MGKVLRVLTTFLNPTATLWVLLLPFTDEEIEV